MIESGLEYGYITTGEGIRDTSYLLERSNNALLSPLSSITSEDVRRDEEGALHMIAISQGTGACIMAVQSTQHSQAERVIAKTRLNKRI